MKKSIKTRPCRNSRAQELVCLGAPEVPRCQRGDLEQAPLAPGWMVGIRCVVPHAKRLSAGHPPSPGTVFPEGQVDSLLSIISSQRERFRARNQELEGVRGVGRAAVRGLQDLQSGAGCFTDLQGIYYQHNAGSKRKIYSAVGRSKASPSPSVLLRFKDRSKSLSPCRCAWPSGTAFGSAT